MRFTDIDRCLTFTVPMSSMVVVVVAIMYPFLELIELDPLAGHPIDGIEENLPGQGPLTDLPHPIFPREYI